MYMYFDLMPQSVGAQEVVRYLWFLLTPYQLGSTKSSATNQFGHSFGHKSFTTKFLYLPRNPISSCVLLYINWITHVREQG